MGRSSTVWDVETTKGRDMGAEARTHVCVLENSTKSRRGNLDEQEVAKKDTVNRIHQWTRYSRSDHVETANKAVEKYTKSSKHIQTVSGDFILDMVSNDWVWIQRIKQMPKIMQRFISLNTVYKQCHTNRSHSAFQRGHRKAIRRSLDQQEFWKQQKRWRTRTFFSVLSFCVVFWVTLRCVVRTFVYPAHTRWLKLGLKLKVWSTCFSCVHPNKTFSPHIMSLLGVPTLSSFCSTPPPSWTPSQRRWLEPDRPLVHSAKRMDSLALCLHDIPPQVLSPNSASTSAVSTRRSIFNLENDLTNTVAASEDFDHLVQRFVASSSQHSWACTVSKVVEFRFA